MLAEKGFRNSSTVTTTMQTLHDVRPACFSVYEQTEGVILTLGKGLE